MSKIERLTDEQTARLADFRDEWTRVGLCTDPADRPAAERAIVEMYAAAGLPPPKRIVWCGSPLSQGIVRAIILDKKLIADIGDSVRASVRDSVRDSVRASVGDRVWASVGASVRDSVRASVWASVGASVRDSVRDSVWASVGDRVRASVRDSVRASVGDRVWASVWASVRNSVGASVWDGVGASVRDSVRDSVRASVWDGVGASVGASVWASVGASVYGAHDAGWLSFYDFFRRVCALESQAARLLGLDNLARAAGWALPHSNICWVSERHSILSRDDRGRLHAIGAPACAYPDGWAIYAVNGVRVPEYVVMRPGEITVDKMKVEENVEVRRAMREQYGVNRWLKDIGARVVHMDSVPTDLLAPGATNIVRALMATDDGDRYLVGSDGSTSRVYPMRVPAECETCEQAHRALLPDAIKDKRVLLEA